jgi:predicted metalloendopeptidase
MVSDLRGAFHDLLSENEWMDDSTRQSAAEKADAMLVLLGFPSWCDSSSELDYFYKDVSGRLGSEGRLNSHPITNLTVSFASMKK